MNDISRRRLLLLIVIMIIGWIAMLHLAAPTPQAVTAAAASSAYMQEESYPTGFEQTCSHNGGQFLEWKHFILVMRGDECAP